MLNVIIVIKSCFLSPGPAGLLMLGLQRVLPGAAAVAARSAPLHDPGRGRIRRHHGHRLCHLQHTIPKRSLLL